MMGPCPSSPLRSGGAIRRPDLDRWPWGSVHHYELPLGIQSSFYALLHSRSLRLLAMKSFSLCAAHRVKCLELLIHGLGSSAVAT